MGEKGEGSGGEGGGKWGERGRELGMGYPPVHPLNVILPSVCVGGHFVKRRKLICATLVKGIMGNIFCEIMLHLGQWLMRCIDS